MSFDGKQWLSYAIPIGFLGLAVALAQTGNGHGTESPANTANIAATLRAAPCGQPVKYKLGTIDRRFGMTDQDALVVIRDATRLWNSATDIGLVEYGGDTGIPINFVYDDRERMSQDHAAYAATIRQAAAELKQIDDEVAAVRGQLTAARNSFSSQEGSFKAKLDIYNADVERLNGGGGGTYEQGKVFDESKRQLDQQLNQLKDDQAAINELIERENALIAQHNALVNRANAVINIVNQDVGKGFIAGLYAVKDGRAQIDIFAFVDRPDLVRLLAHEFGHALGLGHVGDPNSVMAASRETGMVSLDTTGKGLELSSEDRSALRGVCGKT